MNSVELVFIMNSLFINCLLQLNYYFKVELKKTIQILI